MNSSSLTPSAAAGVDYSVCPHPASHLFEVTLQLNDPAALLGADSTLTLHLPTWVPGSYMIRDMARHLERLSAEQEGQAVRVQKTGKSSWQLHGVRPDACVLVRYWVYAYDASVRGCYLDASLGLITGSSLLLWVDGASAWPHRLRLHTPPSWLRACALPTDTEGAWLAEDYDALVDAPVFMGPPDAGDGSGLQQHCFDVAGVPHELWIHGAGGADFSRLLADTAAVCARQIQLFGGTPPFSRYLFLLRVQAEGYGGLEHSNSTVLLCARSDLPQLGESGPSRAYQQLLGLISHEYFHLWNVKRIRPLAFGQSRQQECLSTALWQYEGITAYYDDLMLCRSQRLTVDDYLQLLARQLTQLSRSPGLRVQSLAESSWDAWIKYYRPDENSPNAQISYYTQGALLACWLDLHLRTQAGVATGLDAIMQALWQQVQQQPQALTDGQWYALAQQATGVDVAALVQPWLTQAGPIAIQPLLEAMGLEVQQRVRQSLDDAGGWLDAAGPGLGSLGVRAKEERAELVLTHVLRDSVAEAAGLQVHDRIIALNGRRLPEQQALQHWHRQAQQVQHLSFFRDGWLRHTEVAAAPQVQDTWGLRVQVADSPLRQAWLGQ